MTDFEKFKEKLPGKEIFYSSLTNRNINGKAYGPVVNVWSKSEMKAVQDYHDLYLKISRFIISWYIWKIWK